MKNELITKEVNFNGDILMAAQDDTNNKIYVGVRWVCEGIGLTEGQMKNERLRIGKDLALLQGGRNLILPTNSGEQDVLCIELEFLPLWLAKIPITPKMMKVKPDVAKKLVNYQIQAKDVLAKAFIHKDEVDINNFQIPTTLSEALLLAGNLAKENEVMKPKAEQFDLYLANDGTLSLNESAKALKTGRNKMMRYLRYKNVFNQDNSPGSYCSNREYFEVKTFTVIKKNEKKYQIAITRVTPKGQDFLYRFLKKNIDEYSKFDKNFKNRLQEVSANA